jgi:hypothetical protein
VPRGGSLPAIVIAAEEELAHAPATAPTVATDEPKQKMRAFFEQCIKSPADITVSFDKFPYHLDPSLRDLLISSVFLFLEKPDLLKFTANMQTISRRILLSSPTGTLALETLH